MTETDMDGREIPEEYSNETINLKQNGCPICEGLEFREGPAGYFACETDGGCLTIYAGDPTDVNIAYLGNLEKHV